MLGLVFAAYLALCGGAGRQHERRRRSRSSSSRQEFMKSIPLLVLAGLGYLAFALAMNVVIRVYLMRDLWVQGAGLGQSSAASRLPPTLRRGANWPTRSAKGLPTASMSAASRSLDCHG